MHQYLFEVIRGAIVDIDKAHNVAIAAVEAAQDLVTSFRWGEKTSREQLSGRI